MSMMPDFVRRPGNVPALPARIERPRDPDTTTVVDRILATERERDQLIEREHALEIDNGFLRERIRVLEESLTEAERKRDLYQFHSTAFTVRLQDLFVLAEEQAVTSKRMIGEMLKQAKDDAFAPRETQSSNLPEAPGAAELAAKLAAEQPDA